MKATVECFWHNANWFPVSCQDAVERALPSVQKHSGVVVHGMTVVVVGVAVVV